MLRQSRSGEVFTFTQHAPPPTVYLDQWALMDVAEDATQRDRLSQSLRHRGGTLLLSWFHLQEFSKVTSRSTAEAVEQLLTDLDRHLAFLLALHDQVIDAEDRLLATPPQFWHTAQAPHLDNEILRLFASDGLESHGFLQRFQSPEVAALCMGFERVADEGSRGLAHGRARLDKEPEYRKNLEKPPTGPVIPHPTRYVAHEAMRFLIRDRRAAMKTNDWADFFHMIVAISYCDFVVLDKRWAPFAGRIQKWLDEAGLLKGAHFARVFRKLPEFWKAFDP